MLTDSHELRSECNKVRLFSTLQVVALALQIPSLIVYLWNVRTYHTLHTTADYFIYSNALIFILALIRFLQLNTTSLIYLFQDRFSHAFFHRIFHYLLQVSLLLSCFVSIILVVYTNPLHFFQVCDKMTLICVSLSGILWWNGPRSDFSSFLTTRS